MTAPETILLDTNVLLHVVRASEVAARIDAAVQLRSRPTRPLVSIVSVGEAQAFALRRGWGDGKRARLDELVREFVIVGIDSITVLGAYAEMHSFLVSHGHVVGDNDIWIAACAKAASAVLITTDKDFDPLHPSHVERLYFEPNLRKS